MKYVVVRSIVCSDIYFLALNFKQTERQRTSLVELVRMCAPAQMVEVTLEAKP